MNLIKLFEMQRKLDEKIVEEKGLKGQDLLPKKILALQVELGELCQKWRGFKFWSEDQEPRTVEKIATEWDDGGNEVEWHVKPYKNPLLEEYVDCLHFILSIGLELELNDRPNSLTREIEEEPDELVLMFEEVLSHTCDLFWSCYHDDDYEEQEYRYKAILGNFLKLGEMLGFTTEQVEKAYLEKNKVNHERQREGY